MVIYLDVLFCLNAIGTLFQLLAAQLLGYAHPVFTALLMAALSARAGFRLGLEG